MINFCLLLSVAHKFLVRSIWETCVFKFNIKCLEDFIENFLEIFMKSNALKDQERSQEPFRHY